MLNDLGYKACVKPISPNIQFTYIQNTNNKVQISVSQWYQDYPRRFELPASPVRLRFFQPGSDASVNIAGFCDEAIDQKMQEAHGLGHRRPGQGRQQLWAEVDKAVTDAAPAAVLFTPKRIDLVSRRLELHIQPAILLDRQPVLGRVVRRNGDGAGHLPPRIGL